MSTSRTPEATGWQSRVDDRVDPDDAAMAAVLADCEELMARTPELDYLAYVGLGTPLVELVRTGVPAGTPGAPPSGSLAEAFKRLAKQMALRVWHLDRELQVARTGRLIRTVLHSEGHALFYDMVRPGVEFLGVVTLTDHPDSDQRVWAGDRAVAALADKLRARAELKSVNYGSFEAPFDGTAPQVPATGGVEDRLRAAVGPVGLHFASYWAGDRSVVLDCLDDPELAADHVGITPAARRGFHLRFARDLRTLATELKQTCGGALRGRLNRVVLDVEQGAVYYLRLPAQRYVTAVTIRQPMVSLAGETVGRLAKTLLDPALRTD
ncbi:hypothetical protein [Actinokineospora sp. NBRC 105648]|uniref:hypothetical protein n=1 Tax=Actinokineospora sp. NBRC 105648 TaxID=3032206 RepID=UPI0024A51FD1|nr:hypothetical protein [Actinokineospora sp. NBRC 105648]GLZ41967.1 hypothetical protein Acsp05_55910 [Actinokineospora sp. NBRC 105648]